MLLASFLAVLRLLASRQIPVQENGRGRSARGFILQRFSVPGVRPTSKSRGHPTRGFFVAASKHSPVITT